MNFQFLSITRDLLKSREVRERIGERIFDPSNDELVPRPEPQQGINWWLLISAAALVFPGLRLAKLAKFVIAGAIRFFAIKLVFGQLWEILVEKYFELKTFDWNQMDSEIENQIKSNNEQIAGAAGSLFGSGLVWTVSATIAGKLIGRYPVLAGRIALELADEGKSEVTGQLNNFFIVARNSLITNLILTGFLTLRRLRLFGLAPVATEKKPWTIADKVDEFIDKNFSGMLEAFIRQALEQIEESLIEVGYIVSLTIDDFYAAQKEAMDEEPERTLIITPNKEAEDEQLVLSGSQSAVEQSLQTTLATHTLVHNRDVGQIVGNHYDDWYRAKPFRRSLKVVFHDKKEPPYVVAGKASMTAELTIPDPLPGLSWEKIKRACEPFTWGPVMVTQKLDNGRKCQVNASTVSEGKKLINRLLTLTTAKPEGTPFKTEPDQDNLDPELKIRPTLVYPAYGTLIVREPTYNGTSITYKKNKESATRFELWTTRQPENFKNLPA